MIDILKELYDGSITVDQAYNIYDDIMDSLLASYAAQNLGLTLTEWTAFCHGLSLDILAHWRYEHWPDICPVCLKKIEIDQYGWFASKDHEGIWILRHIKCIDSIL
jgi:hypothetical protein